MTRNRNRLLGLALLSAATLTAPINFPAAASAARAYQGESADRVKEEVLVVDRTWARAHQTGDRALMLPTLAEDLKFVHTNGDIDDRDKELTRISGTLETRPEVLDFRAYGDTAIVIGKLHITRKQGSGPSSVMYTRVYVRRGAVWRMVSHHATDLPSR